MTDAQPQAVKLSWSNPYAAPDVTLPDTGQVIAGADRVTLDCKAGEPPKVFIEIGSDAVVGDVQGVVHVVHEVPADPLKAVQDFLANIDDEALTAAILEDDTLAGKPFGAAALEVMQRWARGD